MTKLKGSDRAFDLESDAATEAATAEHCAPPFLVPSNGIELSRLASQRYILPTDGSAFQEYRPGGECVGLDWLESESVLNLRERCLG